ncbi:MAG: C69 family dipeptidase [Bacteroidales bacterium]|nr:C69 family dipeptidase [Bacteroidales bacterium]
MKQIFRKLALASAALLLPVAGSVEACTNFLITKGASKDGSTMISYAADSHVLYGELYYRPAADYPEGAMMDIYEWDTGKKLGQIKQARHTYSVVGNMNEHQLAIGETTFGGLHQLLDTTGIVDYGSLIYITLQRAKTAREAIKVMHELTSTYGYASEGESFSIADPNEVWILEMVGKGGKSKGAVWVAYRIPDGCISGHANQARITKIIPANGKTSISSKDLAKKYNLPNLQCIYAADVVDFAKSEGLFNGKFEDFSFSDTYCPLSFSGMRACEARVWAAFMKANPEVAKPYEDYARGENKNHRMPLWIEPNRKLTLNDMFDFMRDHFEGTSLDMSKDLGAGPFGCPYRWRPMGFEYEGRNYIHERATSTQQTGFSFIAQCRSWMPDPVGGILWFGVDDTYFTCYTPMYCGITEIPECFREGNGNMAEYSPTSAFWLFNIVSNFAYTRYSDMIVDIRKVQKRIEESFQTCISYNDEELKNETDHAALVEFANNFSNAQAGIMFREWQDLSRWLLVKYMDGNIKKTDDKGNFIRSEYGQDRIVFPLQPEYPKAWYKMIVDDCGENIKEVE